MSNEVGVLVANCFQPCVDLTAAVPLPNDAFELAVARWTDTHADTVISEDCQFLDIFIRLAGHNRVHTASIVPDHSADGAAAVRRRVGPEGQIMFLGSASQVIEDDARLDPCSAVKRINLEDPSHVLREIDHNGDIAALSGERRPSTPTEQGRAMLAANRNCSNYVVIIARQNNSDWNLAIIRTIGGVEGAAAVIETNVAA